MSRKPKPVPSRAERSTLPAPPPKPTARVRQLARELHEAETEARVLRARRNLRRLKESAALDSDWVGPWAELLRARADEPGWWPILSPSARRYGANFPFFQTEQELAIIRDLSRVVCQTNNHAIGLLGGWTSFVAGTGFAVKVAAKPDAGPGGNASGRDAGKAAAARVTAWADRWSARNDWGERQQELVRRTERDGDGILRTFNDDGWLKVRFVWPEQVTQPPGESFEEWSFGRRCDPEDAETTVEYYVAPVGDPAAEGEFVPADEIEWFAPQADRGVKRGLPAFSFGTREAIDIAGRLTRNLGEGGAVREAIAYMRQHAAATESDIEAANLAEASYREREPLRDTYRPVVQDYPGMVVDFPEGMEHAGAPANPGTAAHSAVVDLLVRSACCRWNAPEWLGSANAANMGAYTSSLVAESPFVKRVVREQGYYKARLLRVVNRALDLAAASGLVRREDLDLVTVDLVAPSPEVRNKLEESQRAQIEIPLGVDSRQRYCESQDRDYERVAADNQAYKDQFGDGDGGGGGPPVSGGGPGDDGGGAGADTHPGGGGGLPGFTEAIAWEAVGRVLHEHGFSGTITDAAGRKRTYADGKQVAARRDASDPDRGGAGARTQGGLATAHQLDAGEKADLADGLKGKVLAADPTAAANPTLLARVGDKALTAAARVYGVMLRLTPAMVKAGDILGDVFDTPTDLRTKFGYNPSASGGSAASDRAGDPLKAAGLPIGTHLAATIASHVLAKGIVWARKRLAGGRQESEQDDPIDGFAAVVADALKASAEEFGLPDPPDAGALAEHFRGLSPEPSPPDTRTPEVPESLLESLARDHFGLTEAGEEWVSEDAYRLLLEAERAGLALVTVTDRNGNRVKRWVRQGTASGSEGRPHPGRPGEAAIARAINNPGALTAADVMALKDHIRRVPKERLRQLALAARQRIGPTKAAIADRLLEHVRAARGAGGGAGATSPPPVPTVTPPTAPPRLPSNATVTVAGDERGQLRTRQTVAAVFGSDILSGVEVVKPEVLAAASNALDGARVDVGFEWATGRAPSGYVTALTVGSGYDASRTFYREPDGTLVCRNDSFEIDKVGVGRTARPVNPDLPGGTDMLANQVRALRALGVSRIDTYAAGNRVTAEDGGYNGYYSWPRMGYDGPLAPDDLHRMPAELRSQMGESRSILKLFETEAGRDWWYENGNGINLTFDLRDGSPSMRVLDAYLNERAGRPPRPGA